MENSIEKLQKRLSSLLLMALVPLLIFTVSCNEDDEDPTPGNGEMETPTENIVELAQGSDDLSTLVSALIKYDDLVAALSDADGQFTVFAPTNAAFGALLEALGYESLDAIPEDLLKSVLQYHVISGNALMAGDLSNGQTAETLLAGESITVNINGSTVMINMSTVVSADIEATNGVVHVIDAVLVPASLETRSIVDLAVATEDLSVLVQALTKFDDLVAALSEPTGSYTVFAPTNDAFIALLETLGYASLDDVPEDLLKQVLQYHVIGGAALQAADLSDGQTAATLLTDQSVEVSIEGGAVSINNSKVVAADVAALNGVVHLIDAVLVPSFVATEDIVEIAAGNDDLSILVTALSKFPDLVEALSANDGSYTVFAPTNDAFAALLGITGQEELDDIPDNVIRRVLEYHVIGGTEAFSADLSDGQTVPTLLTDESVTVSVGASVMIDNATVIAADIEAVNGVVHILDGVLVPSLEASIVNTVVEPAYFNESFTTLTGAVVKAGLLTTLIDASASYTVFAPTNDAFAAAGITSLDDFTAEQLSPILLYHVLGIEADQATVASLGTGSAVETLNGDVYLSINSNGIFLNGMTQVVATDIQADNGVVHVIDRTLIPPSTTVAGIAVALSNSSEAEFTNLVGALTAVQNGGGSALVDILSSSDAADGAPFTVFAPTDAAFQSLFDKIDGVNNLSELVGAIGLNNVEAVLLYHVVSGARVFSTDLPNLNSNTITTLGGSFTLNLSSLRIADSDQALTVGTDDATIIETDILGTNGVIHVIDEVILP